MKTCMRMAGTGVFAALAALGQRIPDTSGSANRLAESTVSLRPPQHQIPAAARKAYDKGRNAAGKGGLLEAAGHFRDALALDPGFADAYNDLGASYLSRGELARPRSSSRRPSN
jgi:Flp pilus assembly protein TadD